MDILLLVLRFLFAALLYAFLAVILFTVWRELRQTAQGEVLHAEGHLTVLQAESESLAPGTTFPLQVVTSIGRSPTNTISLPDTFASARHALLTWREGQWWLEDQDSRNGTLLNDARIHTLTVISAGDVIGIGRTQLKLELPPR